MLARNHSYREQSRKAALELIYKRLEGILDVPFTGAGLNATQWAVDLSHRHEILLFLRWLKDEELPLSYLDRDQNDLEQINIARDFLLVILASETQKKYSPLFYEAVFDVLIAMAKYWPLNTYVQEENGELYHPQCFIILEPIPKEREVYDSEGYQYDLSALPDFFSGSTIPAHPIHRRTYHPRDLEFMKWQAEIKGHPLPMLKESSLMFWLGSKFFSGVSPNPNEQTQTFLDKIEARAQARSQKHAAGLSPRALARVSPANQPHFPPAQLAPILTPAPDLQSSVSEPLPARTRREGRLGWMGSIEIKNSRRSRAQEREQPILTEESSEPAIPISIGKRTRSRSIS